MAEASFGAHRVNVTGLTSPPNRDGGLLPSPSRHEPAVVPLLLLLVLALSVHASLRGLRSDYDAAAYASWFELISKFSVAEFWAALLESNMYFQGDMFFSFELGFAILTFLITRVVDSVEAFFFFVTALCLFIKVFAIHRSCPRPGWALLWYLSWYYLLLEMTTLRAGLAASFVLLGFPALFAGRYWRFVLCTATASLFHVSAMMALLLIPLRVRPFGPRGLGLALLLGFVLSSVSLLPVIELVGQFHAKIAEYYTLFLEVGFYESVNKFNVVVLLRLSLLGVGLVFARNEFWERPGFALSANIYAVSIFFYYAFASFPLVGGRVYEFLGVFQIYYVGHYAQTLRRNILAMGFLLMIVLIQFYMLVFHVRFVDFFYFIGNSYNIETEHRK